MKTPDQQFVDELELFRKEAEAAIQFFYSSFAVQEVAAKNKAVHELLNRAPVFWNTSVAALQQAAFMALGRIFDQRSPHNVDRLVRLGLDNLEIFSKSALGKRKQGTSPNPPEWIDNILRAVYEPTPADFRRFRKHIDRWRGIYRKNYRDIRHKFLAHREVSGQEEVEALFIKGNVKELQRLCVSLAMLHDALWYLFFNGHRPVLRRQRRSVDLMRDKPLPQGWVKPVQERVVGEVEWFLLEATKHQHTPGPARMKEEEGD